MVDRRIVRDVEKQCEGKICHFTRVLAKKQKRQMQVKKGGKWDVYKCPHCGFWHIGHMPKR